FSFLISAILAGSFPIRKIARLFLPPPLSRRELKLFCHRSGCPMEIIVYSTGIRLSTVSTKGLSSWWRGDRSLRFDVALPARTSPHGASFPVLQSESTSAARRGGVVRAAAPESGIPAPGRSVAL